MHYNENLSEALAILAATPPASKTAGTYTVGPFNAAGMGRILFVLQLATPSGGATVDFQVKWSATQGGTYATLTGTAITQVTSGSTPLILVEVKAETVANLAAGGPWLEGVVVVGTAAEVLSVLVLGVSSAYYPASDYNVIAPAQTVVV